MQAGTYVDPALHYEAAAEYCASRGFSDPRLVRCLLDLPKSVLEDIDANPHEWRRRVSEYAYGMAMNATARRLVALRLTTASLTARAKLPAST